MTKPSRTLREAILFWRTSRRAILPTSTLFTTDQIAQASHEAIAQSIAGLKHYAIEVTGYTDKVGDRQYNLQLSRRRADSVVRYLTENGKIPLVRIHTLGYGEDMPAADNKSRDGRKQNRRVEVKVLAPPMTAQASNTQASANPATQ